MVEEEDTEEAEHSDNSSKPTYGPWVAKGNPVCFLDSGDEQELDLAAEGLVRKNKMTREELAFGGRITSSTCCTHA